MYFKEQLNVTRSNEMTNANFDENVLKLEKTEKLFDPFFILFKYLKKYIYFN